jgi:hypothetical protein
MFKVGQEVNVTSVPKGEEHLEYLAACIGEKGFVAARKVDDKEPERCLYDYIVIVDDYHWGLNEDNLEAVKGE